MELAYAAGRAGGTMPAVMNAANEEAVAQFLEEKIHFLDIPDSDRSGLRTPQSRPDRPSPTR